MATNSTEKPLGVIIGVSITALILFCLISWIIAVQAAKKVADRKVLPAAEEIAKNRVLEEVTKTEFIQYIVGNVKDAAMPEIQNAITESIASGIKPTDSNYKEITDNLRQDLAALTTKTDDVVLKRIGVLEQTKTNVQESVDKSSKMMNDFINLTLTDLVPAGTVSAFFCKPNSPPAGWLVCDGKTISSDPYSDVDHKPDVKYTRLITILSSLGKDEGENSARLPDLRGLFLRGVDDEGKVGQLQESSIKKHRHPIFGETQSVGFAIDAYPHEKYRVFMTERRTGDGSAPRPVFRDTEYQGKSSIDHGNFVIEGTDETRPRNVEIVWCIKY
jgi:microcystin-dependent protein